MVANDNDHPLGMNKPHSDVLKDSLSLSTRVLARDIGCLMELSDMSIGNEMMINRLISILRRNGYYTVGDIASASEKQIRLIKHVGEQTLSMLLELLRALSESEELISASGNKRR
jgi:DNA-directed RNA polymerase alpha subunit